MLSGFVRIYNISHTENFSFKNARILQDKHVHIYEEQEVVTTAARETRERWMRKTQLSDSKGAVHDVKFAPRHLGLKLAAGSADGFVRIYEATDVFALNYWYNCSPSST